MAFLVALAPSLAPAKNFNKKCSSNKGRTLVYGIGASTMGSVLGPMLEARLKDRKISFRQWGKASSGLARPDFHDWPSKVRGIARGYNPELFIVSLGTNDYQPLWNKKKWVRFEKKQWREIYKSRVEDMLQKLVGKEKNRAVIWIGPAAFEGARASKRGKVVQEIIKQVVTTFDGPVAYYDLFKLTSNRDGSPISTYIDHNGKKKKARARDGIHLSTRAVRALIAVPVVRLIDECLGTTAPKKKKKTTKKKKRGKKTARN
jgi:hypothetical protein